jgi:hypothetical protein
VRAQLLGEHGQERQGCRGRGRPLGCGWGRRNEAQRPL